MPISNLITGALVLSAATAAFLVSSAAVNEAIPLEKIYYERGDISPVLKKGDRSHVEEPTKNDGEFRPTVTAELNVIRLCSDINGQRFGWEWPNVPFAAIACDNSQADRHDRAGK